MAIWSERKSVRREDISSRQSLRTRFDKWHEKTCRSHDGSHSLSHAYGKLSSGKYYECDSIRLDSICAALHHHIISHPFPSMWVYELRIISKFCTPPPLSGRILVSSTFGSHLIVVYVVLLHTLGSFVWMRSVLPPFHVLWIGVLRALRALHTVTTHCQYNVQSTCITMWARVSVVVLPV